MPSKTVRRPWALRLVGVMSLLVLGWTFSPQLLSFFADKDKEENLPPELAVVPPDAFVFTYARPAEIWDHETIGKLRELLKEHKQEFGGNEFPVNPGDTESVSLVVMTAQTVAMFQGGLRPKIKAEIPEPEDKVEKKKKDDFDKIDKKKVDEPKKDDLDKKKDDSPKVPEKKKVDEPKEGKKFDDKEPAKKIVDEPKEPAKKGDEAKRKVSKDVTVGQLFSQMGDYVVQLKYPIKYVEPAAKDGVEAIIQGARVTFKQTVDSPLEDKEIDFIIRGVPDTVDDVKVTIIMRKRDKSRDDLPKNPIKKKVDEPRKDDLDKKKIDEPRNEITSGTFVGKGGTLTVPFKYGKVKAVEPGEKDGVQATIEEDRVTFKQLVDAPDDKDRQIVFTIRGGPGDKDEVKITITMKKSIIAREPARLKGDGYLYDKGTSCVVRAKFKVTSVDPDETEGVQAKVDGELKVVFTQTVDSPDADRKVEFTIRGGLDDKQEQKVAIIVRKKLSPKDDDLPKEPQKKEPEKTRDDDKPGKTEGSQAKDDFPQPQALVVVKMKEPLGNRLSGRIISLSVGENAKKREHNGKNYLMNAAGNCLYFLNDTTFVAATTEAVMKKVLDRPEQVKASGAQAAALNLAAKKHHLVVGVNLTEPTCVEMKKRLAVELTRDRGGDAPAFVAGPLLETQSAVLSVDLGKENRVKVEASLSFPNAEKAAEAVGALQDTLAVARIFTLGRLVQELNFEAGFDEQHRKEIFFVIAAAKQAEAALRAAAVERRQSLVTFQAEGQFDVDYLRGKAKIAAENYKIDPAVRQAIYRTDSINNLKQMTLAMHSYHDVYKSLPPHAITDWRKDGKPLLSWRVAILPWIEQQQIYNEFKLDEPWDSEHNIKLVAKMPRIYAPLGVKTKEPYTTFYQVFTGPDTPFEIITKKDNFPMARRLGFIPDGTSNTIAIVEAGEPVIWTKPDDLPYDAKKPLPKIGGTLFADGFHCSMCDGSVRFVKPAKAGVTPEEAARRGEVSEETLRNAITCSDGMPLGPDW